MYPLAFLPFRSGARRQARKPTGRLRGLLAALTLGIGLPVQATEIGAAATIKTVMPRGAAVQPTAYLRVANPGLRGSSELQWIDTRFRNLDGADVELRFALPGQAGLRSMRSFGISEPELEALFESCRRNRTCNQDRYQQQLEHYYHAHKLRLRSGPGVRTSLYVDVPKVVEHHRADVRPVAAALRQWAQQRGHTAQSMFDAAASLVQTGLAYRTPAAVDVGRKTLGFYPPPRALEKGYGDCDTKAALLAAILANLGGPKVIGVRVPDHYLLGIARTPRAGESWIEHQGQAFVLLEAAGPARRPPGQVSDQTQVALATGQPIRIDPMF